MIHNYFIRFQLDHNACHETAKRSKFLPTKAPEPSGVNHQEEQNRNQTGQANDEAQSVRQYKRIKTRLQKYTKMT